MQGSLNEQMELPNPGGGEMPRIIRLQPDRKGGALPPPHPYFLLLLLPLIGWDCVPFLIVIHS